MTTQPETRIQRAIQTMVRERGGFVFKVHGSETMMAGLPDLIVCYRGLFVAFEVKTPSGKVSPRQRYVMRNIMGAQGVVTVPRSVTDARAVLDMIDDVIDNDQSLTEALSAVFARNGWRG